MTTCHSILSITVTKRSLSPSTVMMEPWKKSKNQTKICATQKLPQNQLINAHFLNALPEVTFCPINVNGSTNSFKKTLVSLDPALLMLPVPPPLVKHYIADMSLAIEKSTEI